MTQIELPQTDLERVVESRTREWHFHIYFLLQSPTETTAALAIRDAVLRLRREGERDNSTNIPKRLTNDDLM